MVRHTVRADTPSSLVAPSLKRGLRREKEESSVGGEAYIGTHMPGVDASHVAHAG